MSALPENIAALEAMQAREHSASVEGAVAALRALTTETATPDAIREALSAFTTMAKSLSPVDRELARDAAISTCKSLGISSRARLVDAAMPAKSTDDTGTALAFSDAERWPDEVAGTDLLDGLLAVVRRHLAILREQAVAVILWIVFSHAHDAFQVSPLLGVVSPEKRCGKSTLLSLLGALVPRPVFAANITPAAVFRIVESVAPSLLVDEADTFLRSSEELRGILNSGHLRRLACVPRCDGDEHEVKLFSTWAPKALACIGTLPSTLEDRAVVVTMRRKAPGETVEALRLDRLGELEDLRRRVARWAGDHLERLRHADALVPAEIDSDRARDNWRPLLAIAEAVGGEWPGRARLAAVALAGREADSESLGVMLLTDIRAMFDEIDVDPLTTDFMLERLRGDAERPWGDLAHGQGLNAHRLARLLRPFAVRPKHWRDDGGTRRGYLRADFADAFTRYTGGVKPAQAAHASIETTYTPTKAAQDIEVVPLCASRKPNGMNAVPLVPVPKGGNARPEGSGTDEEVRL